MAEELLPIPAKPIKRITLDTLIPAIPGKSERLLSPKELHLDSTLKSLDHQISQLREKKLLISQLIQERKEGGKIQNSSLSARVYIDSNFALRKEKVEQIKKFKLELELLKREFFTMVDDQKKIRPKIKIFDKGKTEEKISVIQNKIECTTLSLQEEKKLIAELGVLQASLPLITQFVSRAKRIDENKARQESLKALIAGLNEEIEKVTEEIDLAKEQIKSLKEQRDNDLPVLAKERKEIQDQVKALKAEKRKMIDEFREKKFAFFKQQKEIKQIEWMMKIKNRLVEQEERRKKIEENEKISTFKKPHKFSLEINKCDAYISYLSKQIPKENPDKKELKSKTEQMIKESEEFFGKIEKKQKKKGKTKKGKKFENLLSDHPSDMVNFFLQLDIKLPSSIEDAKEAIQQLQKKKSEFLIQDCSFLSEPFQIQTFSDRKLSDDVLTTQQLHIQKKVSVNPDLLINNKL